MREDEGSVDNGGVAKDGTKRRMKVAEMMAYAGGWRTRRKRGDDEGESLPHGGRCNGYRGHTERCMFTRRAASVGAQLNGWRLL